MKHLLHRIRTFFTDIHFGAYSLLSLVISVLSGLVLGLQYDPATPRYSVSIIDMLMPFGSYFRSLHFYSSQLFFLLCVCHVIESFGAAQGYSRKQWIGLSSTLPVTLLILFTGYVLRGDSTGSAAGIIAESILLDIPVIGPSLNGLLFSISENGMKRIYLNHIIGFGLFWGWLAWGHLRKYQVSFQGHIILCISILIFPVFIAAPFEVARLGVIHISGPWFFLGLQELLRSLPPLLAGVLVPLSLLVAFARLQTKNRGFHTTLAFIICWLLAYGILTLLALSR